MKIYKKTELPRHEEEEFSVIVLTCDEHGETNLGFYNFDTEDWSFLSEVQSPNQKIPDRKTKCVIKTHINIKQNVIFGAKLKPV